MVSQNNSLVIALLGLVPIGMLFVGSVSIFLKQKTLASISQLIGASCMVAVILFHICEVFGIFPWMSWGSENSVGHYLDLLCAVLGVSLFPIGFLLNALKKKQDIIQIDEYN
jgi:hypothetical protein